MAAGVLGDDQRSRFVREMIAEERFQLREVEILARANGGRLILKASHVRLARAPLSISQQDGVIKVLKRVKCAQRETIRRKQEFAVRAVAGHPGNFQRMFRRKMQSTLYRRGNGAAGSKDGNGFVLSCRRQNF